MTESNESHIRKCALGILSQREHSVYELRQKLLRKTGEVNDIEAVLGWLESLDYLSEARFCETFVRASANKGRGPVRILNELTLQKRVDKTEAERALSDIDIDWVEEAATLVAKRLGGLKQDYDAILKQKRFLQYRGFTVDQIEQAIERLPV